MKLNVKGSELKMQGFKEFLVDAYGFTDNSLDHNKVAVKTFNKTIEPCYEVGPGYFDVVEDAETIDNLIDNYINLRKDIPLNEMSDEVYSNYVRLHTEQQKFLSEIFTNCDNPPNYKYVAGYDDYNPEEGLKESYGKTPYEELDWDYIDSMAHRMEGNDKYPPENWKKEMDIRKLATSAMRHARAILEPSDYDTESQEDHAVALGCNGMMINYQLK